MLATGLGLIVLDGTIVGVALPSIIADLHLDITDAQWVNSLYAVLLAALLPSTGKLADALGRRRLFLLGLVVFAAGSGLAAAAGDAGALIGSRAVQALGAAMIMASTLSTVNAVFRGRHRAAAFGVWGAVISGAAAVGPLAGGALVFACIEGPELGWRARARTSPPSGSTGRTPPRCLSSRSPSPSPPSP
ncbi:MFS transporter [Corynebacterium sp.]|uniref:MFS transporter n=1 Tax=Corynebacterium sp. TaxID=1720 RepID=UPI0026DCB297|nr:MFS transporter [Corynebacterium sp.]MDO4611186.1 MFS transporter [Corynebacterium sp.]